ncbi:CLUMA_CG008964, isoform A [Clunio marinus]|uniref:CLUMA_CG008964, isoform A n=1 Tax=Clunio marinus TaxID=568069 RepID=A0A1J1I580_9DIPT|nr:CLUMA_CG008964, isoform A [Clunio marinus]
MNCVVVGGGLLTSNGWAEMRTLFNSGDIPFRISIVENRKFLQWTGDVNIRNMLQGRLVKVDLACRIDGPSTKIEANTSPCIAFRVVGSPIKTTSNVTEVQFASEPTEKGKESLTTNEYAVIAIASFCLGLMYIASVFLYIYLKKRKDQPSGRSSENLNKSFSREDESDFPNTRASYRRNASLGPSMEFLDNPEPNVVKNNPLMKHFMSFNENNGFVSDSSDAESSRNVQNEPHDRITSYRSNDEGNVKSQMGNEAECLPEEDVSITEDSENKLEANRTFQNGNVRRKLYFNPAYFEPSLLASPPPSAIEFLTKIREVITMAKGKMAAKKFLPSLNEIPEENSYHSSSEIYSPNTLNSRKSSVVSSRRTSSKDCAGCPGCEEKKTSEKAVATKNCKNCGEKQKSIQKWLENVSTATESSSNSGSLSIKKKKKKSLISMPIMEEDKEELIPQNNKNEHEEKVEISEIDEQEENYDDDDDEEEVKSVSNENIDQIPIIKGYVKEKNIFIQRDTSRFKDDIPPESGSIPKIISHSLKKNIKEMIYSQNFVRDKVHVFESKQSTPVANAVANRLEANEIYNNPRFNIDDLDMTPGIAYSSVMKKKSEVLDQYANPFKRTSDQMLKKATEKSKSVMPDMIYEAIEMEKKNKPINYQLPTPDYYSSEYEMTKFHKRSDGVTFVPFVPTPDYHTYGKNSLRNMKHYQPDSPIYSRKSPAYLVVDYETDSLERVNTLKNRTPVSTPTRSDFSSQSHPSPSALPMEEEVEIRNAIYDKEEGFRKDTDTIKKEREIDIQMRKTKIKYNTPSEGSMTIELEAISPDENDEASTTGSDQFEPDTLDRHSKINRTVLEKLKMERKNLESEDLDKFDAANNDVGRIMTLEVRHSKRQRTMGFASLEKLPEGTAKKEKPTSNPPDVISSNLKPILNEENNDATKSFQNRPTIPNQQLMLNEHEFKKSLISPPILTMETDKKAGKTLRGEFLKMDLLKIEPNFHENALRNDLSPTLIKTVYHVELPSPDLNKEIFNENGKKSKDFKNAWRRFMGIAEKNVQNNLSVEIKEGKVKDIIKKLNVVQNVNGKLREYDSGYLSAESVKDDQTKAHEIVIERSSQRVAPSRPQVPPPPVPSQVKSNYLNHDDLVNIHIYSSDEERNSSLQESDDEEHLDDGTESGTESWKFFKT